MKRSTVRNVIAGAFGLLVILLLGTLTHAKLSANKLSANKLNPYSAGANSAATSRFAGGPIASGQLGPNRFAANPEAIADFMTTEVGREVLGFIVSCALPEGSTFVTNVGSGNIEFLGELGLADEWLTHPLKKAGRGWVSACLFARINDSNLPLPISLRGQQQSLFASADEKAGWTLEEGSFYGDYFVAPGEPVQWIARRGRDQATGETGGLLERDCTEPDPNNPGYTMCGLKYAG
ncbi:MAG TPA: hypothetical protein VJL58_06270, partial [Pyrinomonadaceae bacterium]|nr:hypothetical protein [Pyrinomonadaceae bacterium]